MSTSYIPGEVKPSEPGGAQYTITATATALSSSGILNNRRTAAKLVVKNASGAANACYIGNTPGVTNTPTNAIVELGAGQSYTFQNISPSQLWIVGTAAAANIAFIIAEY